MPNPYRRLPSLDALLQEPGLEEMIRVFGRITVRDSARIALERARAAIRQGESAPDIPWLTATIAEVLQATVAPTLKPVINASGVIIHTNLGRAPLSQAARQAMEAVALGYSNLEFQLAAGKRGSRYIHAEQLLCRLTGAEAALVVNNNAAAVTLVLRTVAAGKEVIISRGELVEIGGGFRIPEILQQSGAKLVEVGTTNRTRLSDYAQAISSETAALLKVHCSNFRVVGFTAAVDIAELAELAVRQNPPLTVVNDLGSGTLLDTRPFGLAYEPTVQDSVAAGADLTTFSGDKLLGGPQAGIIVGKRAWIERLRRQPLTRALRVDKTTLAALQATLLAYVRGTATEEIPVWQMISAPPQTLAARAEAWRTKLVAAGVECALRPGESAVGGGSLPGETLPTTLLAIPAPHPDTLAKRLRTGPTAVIPRIEEDQLLFDPRTVLPVQDSMLVQAVLAAWQTE